LEDALVDGVLVGHASLDPKEFIKILKIAEKLGK
jgi:triosephosphate isomerase